LIEKKDVSTGVLTSLDQIHLIFMLEETVRMKEEVCGKVTVVSMGPERAEKTLRDALARGADDAVLLTDKGFSSSNTWATSYTLAMAIKKIGDCDLFF